LLPGEFYVTSQQEAIATTLGSCVSACIWDEKTGIGGMNHFMLPLTEKDKHEIKWGQKSDISDANRYGNYAMENLINEILKCGGNRKNLKAKAFGGGKIMQKANQIGAKNAEFILDYLDMEKIPLLSHDLGNTYPRKVLFIPKTGKAFMKAISDLHNNTLMNRENNYSNIIMKSPIEGDIELF